VSVSVNARAARALERLCEHFDGIRIRSLVGEDFERAEREFHEWFVEAEREALRDLLEGLDDAMALRRRTRHSKVHPFATRGRCSPGHFVTTSTSRITWRRFLASAPRGEPMSELRPYGWY